MAARSGSEFLERLSAARVHVEIQGEALTGGVADHPAFRNVVRSYAELYDMQTPASRPSPAARRCTSTTSSATRCGWPAPTSPATTANCTGPPSRPSWTGG